LLIVTSLERYLYKPTSPLFFIIKTNQMHEFP